MLKSLFWKGFYVYSSACLGQLCAFYIGHPVWIEGRSMIPTLFPNEWVWLNTYNLFGKKGCSPGEVGVFRSPRERNALIIKRVIACEGDRVIPHFGGPSITIPRGYCWVEGDNSEFSIDSNDYGPIPMGLYEGKPWRPHRSIVDETRLVGRVKSKEDPNNVSMVGTQTYLDESSPNSRH